jgi:hypothetical protein
MKMATKSKKTGLAPVVEGEVMIFDQQEAPDYISSEQRGSENVGQEDIIIPRLEIVQALSPQVKPGDAKYIEEARPGMLVNSVSQKLYGKEAIVIPVTYQKQWLVWMKRKDKEGKGLPGGFFGAFNSPEEAKDRAEQEGGETNNIEVLDTPQHLCLLLNFETGKTEEVMVSMPRTKAKISRQWNSLVRMAGGDRFARAYRIGTAMEKNKNGEDYMNFTITQLGFPSKPVYLKAEELYKQMQAGRAVVMDVTGYDTVAETDPDSDSEM